MAKCPTPYKRVYDRYSASIAIMNASRRPNNTGNVPTRYYKCPCGRFHLSSKEKRVGN